MRSCESGDSGSASGQALVLLMVALVSLPLAACFGEGGDRDVWDEPEIETGMSIAITERLPLERDGSYEGVFLEMSEGWAEVFGAEREIPFEGGRIRFSLTISTDSREWCDRGEMAVRDDVAGERYVFVEDGDCIRKSASISIKGVFEDVPVSAEGVTAPEGLTTPADS